LRNEQTVAPYLGGDSVAILSELGYAPAEIDDMVTSKTTVDGRR
jgi:crotonobetainyl-CoA:carnitine CoA-transferase CaiB-like acyl-CoA transferase